MIVAMDSSFSRDRRSSPDESASTDTNESVVPALSAPSAPSARVARVAPAFVAPSSVPAGPAPAVRKKKRGKVILGALVLAALFAGGHYGWHWWSVGRFEESTDNAFLQADKVTIASKVTGFVTNVRVGDNQAVHAGDILALIDSRDAEISLKEAEADLQKSRAQLDGYQAAVIQQLASVESAKADVVNAEAGLAFAEQEAKRYGDLVATGAGTTQRAQQTDADLRQRRATLAKNRAALDASRKQVKTYEALASSASAAIDGSQAKVDGAKLNLSYTTITAPVDGVVGDRAIRVGQLVQTGTGLMTVVPMGRDIYLVANFKETQLGHMVPGQPVSFTVDAFDDHVFHGTLDSFSPGTGAQFALLPPENATGNFTKVVQRVPVKIRLTGEDPLLARLRPGLSVEATVDVRDDPLATGTIRSAAAR